MTDSSQEEKQNFLRTNILEKGYDVNSFVDFLIDKKGEGGADVGNWTMSDLKIVVKEFISLQEKPKNNNNNLNQIQQTSQKNINNNKSKNSNNPLENNSMNFKNTVKYDPLSGGVQPNINNAQNQNQNSSIAGFFVSNNIKNNNQFLNNNIMNLNLNNQNNINNQNLQMNPQMQYLQQYMKLINSQNPQFQNQLLQYGLQNQQQQTISQYPQNSQNNFQKPEEINKPKSNNPQINPIPNTNITSTNFQVPITQSHTQNTQLNIPESNDEIPKEEQGQGQEQEQEQNQIQNIPPQQQITQQPDPNKPKEEDDIDISLSYGIITNPTEETQFVDKTPLTMEENPPIIQVGFPEKVDGGFFSKSYITYLVSTNPLNIKVRRRYSDFDWLRQMMSNLYVWNAIPSTPRKNRLGSDKFGEPFLKKRMRTLEKFLFYTSMNPIFKCSQLFYDFISIENEADFQKKKKEYEKMKPTTNISEFKTTNGRVNIEINKNKLIYYENIKDNLSFNESLLIKLNENFKMLKTLMENLTNKIDDIAKIWDDLCQNSTKYFDGDDIIKTYEHMNKLFTNWSEALKRHSNLIHIDIREYFKYTKNNFKSLKELVSHVENHKYTYTKNERNLINKKENLFKNGDINKWDLDIESRNNANGLIQDKGKALTKILYKDTSNVIELKKIYGFYLNRIIEEYERIKAINSNMHVKNIIYACEKLVEIYGDFQKGTADIINFFHNQKFEKKE